MSKALEELIRQKKEIEAQIQALKAEEYVRHGSVKFEKRDIDHCDHPWQVSCLGNYKVHATGSEKLRWWPFIRTKTREGAVSIIPTVIHDLTELYAELTKEDGGDKQ